MDYELNKKGLLHGAIIGLIGVAISFLAYFISQEAYFSWRGFVIMAVSLTLLLVLGRKERKANHGDYLAYKAAFWYCAIALFIMIYINEICYTFMFNVVDPGLQEALIEKTLQSSEEVFNMMGSNLGDVDELLSEMERDLRNSFKPMALLANSWQSLTLALLVALLMALFLRRNRPLFEEVEEENS